MIRVHITKNIFCAIALGHYFRGFGHWICTVFGFLRRFAENYDMR